MNALVALAALDAFQPLDWAQLSLAAAPVPEPPVEQAVPAQFLCASCVPTPPNAAQLTRTGRQGSFT